MPVLQVTNVKASAAHWGDVLGFQSHGFWGGDPDDPDFCIVQRGDVTIALHGSEDGSIPLNQYSAAYICVQDANALCKELMSMGH